MYNVLILIISLIFFLIGLIYKKHNLASPIIIHNGIWFFVSLVGIFVAPLFFELNNKIFTIWLLWSLIINLLFLLLTPKGITNKYPFSQYRSLPNYWIILTPLTLYFLFKVIDLGLTGTHSFLLNIRLANITGYYSENFVFQVFSRLYPLIFVLFLIEIYFNNNKYNRYSTYFYMFVFILETSGKIAIITPIICYIVIKSQRKLFNFKKITIFLVITIVAMLLLHFLRLSDDDSTTLLQFLATYIYSPIIALGEVEPMSGEYWGENVFRLGYALPYFLGYSDIEPIPLILDYVRIPSLTNVYTAMYIYYKDFGLLGVVLGAIFIGFLYSILYEKFYNKRFIGSILYLSLLPPLLLSFFSDLFISLTSLYLQILFYIVTIRMFYARRKN